MSDIFIYLSNIVILLKIIILELSDSDILKQFEVFHLQSVQIYIYVPFKICSSKCSLVPSRCVCLIDYRSRETQCFSWLEIYLYFNASIVITFAHKVLTLSEWWHKIETSVHNLKTAFDLIFPVRTEKFNQTHHAHCIDTRKKPKQCEDSLLQNIMSQVKI